MDVISVIPEPIDRSSIEVKGLWNSFNISWQPCKRVNYGTVFYEVKVDNPLKNGTPVCINDYKYKKIDCIHILDMYTIYWSSYSAKMHYIFLGIIFTDFNHIVIYYYYTILIINYTFVAHGVVYRT